MILLALLTPALDKAIEQAERAVCAANQKVIAASSWQYGMNNRKSLFICRGREVTLAIDTLGGALFTEGSEQDRTVNWAAAMATVGLTSADKRPVPIDRYTGTGIPGYTNHMPGKMWDCPSRNWGSYWSHNALWSTEQYALLIGYMYYGGVAIWENPYGEFEDQRNPPAPRRIGDSGRRVLTSDVTGKVFGPWGGRPEDAWYVGGTPPHRGSQGLRPAGHNQSTLDGAVEWVELDRLFAFHSWNKRPDEAFFFAQEDMGSWNPGANVQSWARNQP